ncbi:MAG: hypothetical protein J6U63_06060 [Clostridia bacterium]|nr:hypothetical protein [Clostridia bacterium]
MVAMVGVLGQGNACGKQEKGEYEGGSVHDAKIAQSRRNSGFWDEKSLKIMRV